MSFTFLITEDDALIGEGLGDQGQEHTIQIIRITNTNEFLRESKKNK